MAVSNLPPQKRRRKWSLHSILWHLWQISFFGVKAAWSSCLLFWSPTAAWIWWTPQHLCYLRMIFHATLVFKRNTGLSQTHLSHPYIPGLFFLSHIYRLKPLRVLCKKKQAHAQRKQVVCWNNRMTRKGNSRLCTTRALVFHLIHSVPLHPVWTFVLRSRMILINCLCPNPPLCNGNSCFTGQKWKSEGIFAF